MTPRRLVLLASRYALNSGDSDFVRHEIHALQERFDEIVVFNCAPASTAETLPLPDKVIFGGNLYRNSRIRAVLSIASSQTLRTMRSIMKDELAGTSPVPRRRVLLDCYLGL